MAKASDFIGIWETNAPGTIISDVFRPGAPGGDLAIFSDGTFKWSGSYAKTGLKTGSWVATGLGDYPLELNDTDENYKWRITLKNETDPGKIFLIPFKLNGESTGLHMSGARRAALPGATVDNGTVDAAPLPLPIDTSTSGLKLIKEISEPSPDQTDLRLQFTKTGYLDALATLKVGESALISLSGSFENATDTDTFIIDFSQLTQKELSILASEYTLIPRVSRGASFQRPESNGRDNRLTAITLLRSHPYKTEETPSGYRLPGLGMREFEGDSVKLTLSQQNPNNKTYRLDVILHRDGGTPSATPQGLGAWQTVAKKLEPIISIQPTTDPIISKPDTPPTILLPDKATLIPFPDDATIIPIPGSTTKPSPVSSSSFYLISPDISSGNTSLAPDGKLILKFSKDIDNRVGTISLYDTKSNNSVRWIKLYDDAVAIKGSTLTVDFNYSGKLDTGLDYTLFLDSIRAADGTYADFNQSSTTLGSGVFGVTYVGSSPAAGNKKELEPIISIQPTTDPIISKPDPAPIISKPDTPPTIILPGKATLIPFPDYATIIPFPGSTQGSISTGKTSAPTDTRPSIPKIPSTKPSPVSSSSFHLISPDISSGNTSLAPDGKLILKFSKDIDNRVGTISLYDTKSNNSVRWIKLYDDAVTIKGSTLTVDFNYSGKLDTGLDYTLFLDSIRATDGTYADFNQSSTTLGFGVFGVTYVGSSPAAGNNPNVSVASSGDPILNMPGVGKARVLDNSSRNAVDFTGSATKSTLKSLKTGKIIDEDSLSFLNRYSIKNPETKTEISKASADDVQCLNLSIGVQGVSRMVTEFVLSTQVKATSFVKIDAITGKALDYTYDPKSGQGAQLIDGDGNGLIDMVRFFLDTSSVASQARTFEIKGTFADAPLAPVYRFYRNGVHLYTTDEGERNNIIQRSYGSGAIADDLAAGKKMDLLTGGLGYSYEGVQYQALETQGTSLYRFFNPSKGYHFNTVNEAEAKTIVQNSVGKEYDLSNAQGKSLINGGWGFQYEGNSFKVSTIAQEGMKSPVYRFFNSTKGVHFYSSSSNEVKSVIANSNGSQYATDSWIASTAEALKSNPLVDVPNPLSTGWGYKFEGIAWFASA